MSLLQTLRMDKTHFSTVSLHDESDEVEYWRTQSPQSRMIGLEFMRQVMYGYDPSTARLQRLLEVVKREQVEYLLIGGYAVGYHGYVRATGDMDIWLALNPENAERVATALQSFGFAGDDVSTEMFLDPNQMVRMGNPPLRIELPDGRFGVANFRTAGRRTKWPNRRHDHQHLEPGSFKANKKASGRLKDLNDLKNLS